MWSNFMLSILSGIVLSIIAFGIGPEVRAEMAPPRSQGLEIRLSLQKAIEIGLENNYDVQLARERIEEARGLAFTRLGALLPNLSGETNVTNRKVFQGQFGGRDAVSEARDIYDLRGTLSQSIFSYSLIQQWRAGKGGVEVSELDAQVTRLDTIATVALLYFEALRGEQSVRAREANVKLNRTLWEMAEGRKAAGAATGLDVTRAQGQYQAERRRLLEAVIARNRSRLNLIRAMGLPNNTRVFLTDNLQITEIPVHTPDEAVKHALENRVELKAQDQRRLVAELQLSSIKGERIPSLNARGDYGLIGEQYDKRFGSHTVGAFLTIPLFDGGQREGRIHESNSRLRQEVIRMKNLLHQISIEARDALLNLETSREQVVVSQEALDLALKELDLSRKAFAIGSVTHIEVINAQTAVAEGRDSTIEALFNFNTSRVNLARAEGLLEEWYAKPTMTAKSLRSGF